MAEPHGIDLAAWFSNDERVVCSACNESVAIAVGRGDAVFCFACGEIVMPARPPEEAAARLAANAA
jgi:hypothetical protein